MIDIRQLSALNLEGVTISAQIQADGTLSPVEGGFSKLLGAARDRALPRIHTVVVHPNQKDVPVELSNPHSEIRVFKAWTLEEAIQKVLVDEQTRWGAIPDFQEVLQRHRDFVGREWLERQVNNAIDKAVMQQGPAYILLTGKPGTGKSAFVAHQVSQQIGAVYHFIRRGEGNLDDPEVLLTSLTAQLRRMYALPVRTEEHNLSITDMFHRVLKQVSRKLEDGQFQVIWVDGLDEAFGPIGRFSDRSLAEFLPLNGPTKNMVLVLTSRPGGEHLNWLNDPDQFFAISIDAQQKNSKEDIQAYLTKQNKNLGLGLHPNFLNRLAQASEGFFVAAVRYLHASPQLKEVLAEWQSRPETIPQGLNGWLNWQWQWLLKTARQQNIPERTLIGVLGYLAVADEKERAKVLFHFLRENELEAYWDYVLQISSELVERVQVRGSTDVRYRFFHPHFAEFIWGKTKKYVRTVSDASHASQKDGKGSDLISSQSTSSDLQMKQRTRGRLLVLGLVLGLAILFGGTFMQQAQKNSMRESPTQAETSVPEEHLSTTPQITPIISTVTPKNTIEVLSSPIPNPTVIWSNFWSQGYGFDAFTPWRRYRNLIRDVAWATDGEGEFQGERVLKISIKDDLLPENQGKYADGSGTTDPGYFDLDWPGYVRADGFVLAPYEIFNPPIALPIVYESSFMVGDDFRRVNTNDSDPMSFDFAHGELNLLSLFDKMDHGGTWYMMANLNLEGTLDKLYPVVISSGDSREEPQRNSGDVFLRSLTQYGQEHPLRANKRYWYQVVVTRDRQIIVSFKDTKEGGYHIYLVGGLSTATNPQVAIIQGPLKVYWFGLGPEFRIISGTFISGSDKLLTWETTEIPSSLSSPTVETPSGNESLSTPTQTIQAPRLAEDFLNNAHVSRLHNFDPSAEAYWDLGPAGKISSGVLELTGDETKSAPRVGLIRTILEQEGVLFKVRYTQGAQFVIFMESGVWATESFRRFGINGGGKPSKHLLFGSQYIGDFLNGNYSPESDHWFFLLMAIDKQGKIIVTIWNPDHPEERAYYQENMGVESQGRYWFFDIEVFKGTVQADDFHILSFESIN